MVSIFSWIIISWILFVVPTRRKPISLSERVIAVACITVIHNILLFISYIAGDQNVQLDLPESCHFSLLLSKVFGYSNKLEE